VEVAGTAIVAVMSPELQTERSLLPRKGSMPMHATPLRNVAQRSAVAVAGCSHPHHPLASEALAPVEGEAEEIEGCRPFGSRTISMRSLPVAIRPLERHESRLVRMQRQPVLLESLRKHFEHAPRVLLEFKQHDGIVGVSYQMGPCPHSWTNLCLEPHVEHFVHVDIRQDWRHYPALRRASSRVAQLPVFQHPCLQPLANETQDRKSTRLN